MSAALRSDRDRRIAFAAASRLLRYPDPQLLEQLELLRTAAGALPRTVGAGLAAAVEHLAATPLLAAQSGYVATFDLRRRNCLYLTYYLNGDTRRRGMALWRFRDRLATHGVEVGGGELPDYLPAVLELGCGDAAAAETALALLAEHHQGVEVLRRSLAEQHSPYAGVVAAVAAALPEPTPRLLAAAGRLVAQGPPAEQVGLTPFVPVESLRMR